jgi:membrane fusion protein, copper/silver efflux system
MFKFLKLFLITVMVTIAGVGYAKEVWYCPMHPNYTSDKPGLCPICSMSLVKKEGHPSEEHALKEHEEAGKGIEGHAAVHLSGEQVQLAGIKIAPVGRVMAVKKIRAAGYVSTMHELFEYQDQFIQAHIDYVTTFRDYKRFEHKRRNWEAHRDVQLKLHETEDKLLRLGLSHQEIEKLKTVNWRNTWDQPELLFFKDDSMYWVVAQIFESDRGFIEKGQEVTIEIPSYHEQAKGIVRSIGGIFDAQTRTVNALIEVMDYRGELEGNMLVNVTVPVELNEALIVPQTAIVDTGKRKIAYVQTKPGVFEPRDINVVALADNGWIIKSGLNEGDQVAVEGNFLLDSESRLQSVLTGAAAGGHVHGN